MTDYIVVFVEPFSLRVTYTTYNSYEEAVVKAREKNGRLDVVIVERSLNEEGKYKYKLRKFGYGRFYDIVNKILLFLLFMLILFISYLYFKYLNHKN